MKPGPKRRTRTEPDTGCVIPVGKTRSRAGYPIYKHGGRRTTAARVVWLEQRGPIPDGLQIDHLCRNRECVNIDHLELVTPAENIHRSPRCKLSVEKVAEIRASAESGAALARRFDVSEAAISMARSEKTWA